MTSGCDDEGILTIQMSGGGPYGFRLSDGSGGQLVISKLRKRGRADEAGLKEGDILLTVNGKTCQGLSCSQAMDLVDTSGQNLVIRVSRGSSRRSSVRMTQHEMTSHVETTTTSTTRSLSVQDKHKQTVYVASSQPVSDDTLSSTNSSLSSATLTFAAPVHHSPTVSRSSGEGGLTVTAPAGVQVLQENNGQTFTLTFGLDTHQQTSARISSSPVVWHPPTPSPSSSSSTTTINSQHTVVEQRVTTTSEAPTEIERKPQLSRILQESFDIEPVGTPTSPTGRTKKMFMDSAFYDDPEHKYPTAEEQIALARKVAMSVLAPANANSRGHKMFVKRRERSVRWEAGYKPSDDERQDEEEDKFFKADPWAAGHSAVTSQPASVDIPTSSAPTLPLTSYMFAPKLPLGEKITDRERLDALSSEELERVLLMEKKSTHTSIAPQICFNLADDLRNMKGRGGQLFAKRQAKSESWTVGGESTEATSQPDSPDIQTSEQSTSPRPVNRLKQMVELPRPAMTPWDAAVQYGTVDPAFAHLEKSGKEDETTAGPGRGRVKSWATANPEAAAGLAAAMTSSLQVKFTGSSDGKTSPTGYQPVKFTVPPSGGATEADDQRRITTTVGGGV